VLLSEVKLSRDQEGELVFKTKMYQLSLMVTQLIPRESLGDQEVEGKADVLQHHGIWQWTVDRSSHPHLQVGYADFGFSL